MCGIGGILGARLGSDDLRDRLVRIGARMQHRGPDDEGIYVDAAAGIGLVHRRLSIIDLSPAGHQPMASSDGRYQISFNGEIYNFQALRSELAAAGCRFNGGSDTEVLLAAIQTWGIVEAARRIVGMFAFALWDRNDSTLYLARDRLGEKPLSLVRLDSGFAFASELSALRAAGLGSASLDREALALYLRYAFVPAPYGIYENSMKVMPGQIVAIGREDARPAALGEFTQIDTHREFGLYAHTYWDPRAIAADGDDGSAEDFRLAFRERLTEAVRLQLHADVPVGAFLSGGIDSSLVCAVAQSISDRPVETFTMGFGDTLFDESGFAERVAGHLGTKHRCVEVSSDDVLRWVPKIADLYDEPFADPSQLPTFLVSRIAREHVTVCLTGDGGDELFGGYNRYIDPMRINGRIGHMPELLLRGAAAVIDALPARGVDALLTKLSAHWPRLRVQSPGKRLHKLADALRTRDPKALYELLMTHWREPAELLTGPDSVMTDIDPDLAWSWPAFADAAMLWDLAHYLPDNNLAKVDRASMAVSLETRLPLLDHRIVELALRMPPSLKIAQGSGKQIMRRELAEHLPVELIERPKMGFSVPIASWLRGPLRGWAEDLLSPATISRVGLFEAEPIRRCWAEHLRGTHDHYEKLWLILQAHAWSLGAA